MMFDPSKPLLTLTDNAIAQVKKLMSKSDSDAQGLREELRQQVAQACNMLLNLRMKKNHLKM